MNAIALIESLSSRGFSVRIDAGIVKVSPSSALTDEDRQAIREHKAELLELLAVETCPICFAPVEEQRGEHYRHIWCAQPGHFDSWRTLNGLKFGETDPPIREYMSGEVGR